MALRSSLRLPERACRSRSALHTVCLQPSAARGALHTVCLQPSAARGALHTVCLQPSAARGALHTVCLQPSAARGAMARPALAPAALPASLGSRRWWGSLLAGCCVVTAAAAAAGPAVHCEEARPGEDEEEDSLVMGIRRLEASLVVPSPGEWKDLEHSKKLGVDEGEGLSAVITTMLHGGQESSFYLQHSLAVASGAADHYMCTVSADSKSDSSTAVYQPSPEGTVIQAIVRKVFTPTLSLQGHLLFQGPQINACRSELKYLGPDFVASGVLALGQRLGGPAIGFNYFQAITHKVALGGDVMFLTQDYSSVSSVNYTLYGAWQGKECSVLGKYDRAHNDITVRYWRPVGDRLKLGTSMNINLEKTEANWDVSFEMPIRVEDHTFPYTTLRTKLNMRSLRLVSSLDHALLSGQGMASLLLSLDHFKEEYKVGVSVKLQA